MCERHYSNAILRASTRSVSARSPATDSAAVAGDSNAQQRIATRSVCVNGAFGYGLRHHEVDWLQFAKWSSVQVSSAAV